MRDEIALPLGDLDLRIGLAAGDELAGERAVLREAPDFELGAFASRSRIRGSSSSTAASRAALPDVLERSERARARHPRRRRRRAPPAPRGHALRPHRARATCSRPRRSRSAAAREGVGDDPLTGRPLRFGPTGYELAGTLSALGPAADAFGHTGAGGSSHGGWPALRTGWSYVTAELRSESRDMRAQTLLAALHEALAAR